MSETLTVTAAEANRSFSKLLRMAREGTKVTITSHGKPVAQLAPIEDDDEAERERRRLAVEELRRHYATVKPVRAEPWTREELYDRSRR